MLRAACWVICLSTVMNCQSFAWAGEVVRLRNCELGLRSAAAIPSLNEMLEYVIDEAYDDAFGGGVSIVKTFKSNFENIVIDIVNENGQHIEQFKGRILTSEEHKGVVSARNLIRFWRPYLDLRIDELTREMAVAGDLQKYDMGVRVQKLKESLTRYAAWAPKEEVSINWEL